MTFAPANIQPDLGFPFPDANTAGSTDQTFRSIVKPDLWGNKMRFRFSNVFGSQPVTFSAVTVALQEYSGNLVDGTVIPVTYLHPNHAGYIAMGEAVDIQPFAPSSHRN